MRSSATGDVAEAARNFAAAAEEFERLGLLVNRVKCRYRLGLAMHEAGLMVPDSRSSALRPTKSGEGAESR